MSTTTIWVDTAKIIEVLLKMRIYKIRLNTHGMKSFNYEWIEEIICPDKRNSFDFGI